MSAERPTIAGLLERAMALDPEGEALRDGGQAYTWREVGGRVARRARVLAELGLERGDRVAVLAHNGAPFFELYFAAASLGAVLMPLNLRLTAREQARILTDGEPRLLVAETGFAELAREACERSDRDTRPVWLEGRPEVGPAGPESLDPLAPGERPELPFEPVASGPDDLAQLYFTSGTTGRAKGVMLSQANVVAHAFAAAVELELSDRDVWAHIAPMFHLADAWATFAVTLVGGTHVFLPRFEAEGALDLLEDQGATLTNLVPTMLGDLVHAPGAADRDWSRLRLLLSGGAPIAPGLVRRIRATFRTEYVQTYGMTETSPYLTLSRLSRAQRSLPEEERLRLAARTGRPFLGVALEVVDAGGRSVPRDDRTVGEIRVRGETVTAGYWRRPGATSEAIRDGWLYTGDLATVDGSGFVEIRDRAKDMILSGGENVFSIEVENVLAEHPAVRECAVFGRPDERWGERVCAAIVVAEGRTLDEEELVEHCRTRLAGFKRPRSFEFRSSLPRTGSGKLAKRLLREA